MILYNNYLAISYQINRKSNRKFTFDPKFPSAEVFNLRSKYKIYSLRVNSIDVLTSESIRRNLTFSFRYSEKSVFKRLCNLLSSSVI